MPVCFVIDVHVVFGVPVPVCFVFEIPVPWCSWRLAARAAASAGAGAAMTAAAAAAAVSFLLAAPAQGFIFSFSAPAARSAAHEPAEMALLALAPPARPVAVRALVKLLARHLALAASAVFLPTAAPALEASRIFFVRRLRRWRVEVLLWRLECSRARVLWPWRVVEPVEPPRIMRRSVGVCHVLLVRPANKKINKFFVHR